MVPSVLQAGVAVSESRIQNALLGILGLQSRPDQPRPQPELQEGEWAELERKAKVQRVGALTHFCLQRAPDDWNGPPESVHRTLSDHYRNSLLRNLFLATELTELALALQSGNIPCLALKGMHLAQEVYPEVAIRQMDDIDLLVPREALAAAVEVTRELGYITREPINVEEWSGSVHHLPRMFNNNNTVLELHWNITWPKDRYALSDLEGLWERARPLPGAKGGVLGLCPEDLILHLCVHAAYQHLFYTGLRPVCDISATIARFRDDLDWEALATRALGWGWQAGTYLMLSLAKATLGAEVPSQVLAALRGETPAEAEAAAHHLLWNITSEAITLPRNMARMWSRGRRRDKIKDLATAMLPNRTRLAKEYALDVGSSSVWLHYPRFVVDMAVRNIGAWRNLQKADPETRQMALSKNLLLESLYGE